MAVSQSRVEDLFRQSGALLEGHFILASGRHSAYYLEKFRIFEQPQLTELLSSELIQLTRAKFGPVETVAGPTTGGILIAQEVARQMGVRALHVERDEPAAGRGRVLRRGQTVKPGERVLVVDDIVTSGGSVVEAIKAVRSAGANVVGVGVFVDRSGGVVDLTAPHIALWTTKIESYDPGACVLCDRGLAATKPGTTPGAVVLNMPLRL